MCMTKVTRYSTGHTFFSHLIMAEHIQIAAYNCNGLGDKPKRIRIAKWLKREHRGILLLQETHSTPRRCHSWNNDFGHQYKAYYSHGSSGRKGVCSIIPKQLFKNFIHTEADDNGRFLVIQFDFDGKKYVIVNVYAPTQNFPEYQITFLKTIESLLEKYKGNEIVMGGDVNIIQNPVLDKYKGENEKPSKVARYLEGVKEAHNLVDIWRLQNPKLKRYTWRRRNPLQQSRIDFWLITDMTNSSVK